MPKVRLTYDKDIRREGTDVLEVSEGRAAVLLNLRRAVLLPAGPETPPAEAPVKKAARRKPKA